MEHRELLQKTPMGMLQGSLLHIALAHHYKRKQLAEYEKYSDLMEKLKVEKESVDSYFTPEAAVWSYAQRQEEDEQDSNWTAQAPVIIQAYQDYVDYYGDDSQWIVLGVEHEYRARIGKGKEGCPKEGYLYTQRADLVVADKVGKVFIVDHKKTARISSRSLEQHTLEGQFLGYQLFGNTKFGSKFGGVMVNRISPQTKATKFARDMVLPAPLAVRDYRDHIISVERRISAYEDRKDAMEWPPKFTQGCYGRYGKCQHWEKCRG